MTAPLLDSRGKLRYHIGAQVDVSSLVKDCTDLDAFQRMLNKQEGLDVGDEPKDEFQELSEMFNIAELDTVRKYGGSMHRQHLAEQEDENKQPRPRLLLRDPNSGEIDAPTRLTSKPDGILGGVYKHVSATATAEYE